MACAGYIDSGSGESNSDDDFGSAYRLDISESDCSDFGTSETESDSDSESLSAARLSASRRHHHESVTSSQKETVWDEWSPNAREEERKMIVSRTTTQDLYFHFPTTQFIPLRNVNSTCQLCQ
ncbi:hypothetical protein TNIN_119351 [Trichonephila inaurata madagascariensis]|uniref:Uncharacterized protein n=1 Tax=Trichonephila inaurata madagascariensis TaxID=2747483 RepID=A0A8X7C453_9ARAC|nr:hypothetical protein TNIN_119351 [Trichonephila inaurata madagascariensis]